MIPRPCTDLRLPKARRYNVNPAIRHRFQLSADFQAILLSFFGQEIVAHSATLFAALGGAFFFVHYLRPHKSRHHAWGISFSAIAALLVTGAIYSGFRIISYGQLAYLVFGESSIDVNNYPSLSRYYGAIIDAAWKRASGEPFWSSLFYRIAWEFYFPLGKAWLYVASIWLVLTAAICYLLFRSSKVPPPPSSAADSAGQILGKEQRPQRARAIEPNDTHNVNDDEARYLIDQFNKYIAWTAGRTQLHFSQWTITLAFSTVAVAILNFGIVNIPMEASLRAFESSAIAIAMVAIICITIAGIHRDSEKAKKTQIEDQRRLLALENHRSKFGSLPGPLTFMTIVELGADDLEKLLKESEPTQPLSPQT